MAQTPIATVTTHTWTINVGYSYDRFDESVRAVFEPLLRQGGPQGLQVEATASLAVLANGVIGTHTYLIAQGSQYDCLSALLRHDFEAEFAQAARTGFTVLMTLTAREGPARAGAIDREAFLSLLTAGHLVEPTAALSEGPRAGADGRLAAQVRRVLAEYNRAVHAATTAAWATLARTLSDAEWTALWAGSPRRDEVAAAIRSQQPTPRDGPAL